MIGVQVTSERVKGRGLVFMTKLRPAAFLSVLQQLFEFREEMEKDMRRPKHGRLYRKKDGRIHQASAPGESPAIDTGRFLDSLYIVGPHWKHWTVEGHVASRLKKAEWLEFGTSKMLPRPVWRIVMRRVRRRQLGRKLKFRVIP